MASWYITPQHFTMLLFVEFLYFNLKIPANCASCIINEWINNSYSNVEKLEKLQYCSSSAMTNGQSTDHMQHFPPSVVGLSGPWSKKKKLDKKNMVFVVCRGVTSTSQVSFEEMTLLLVRLKGLAQGSKCCSQSSGQVPTSLRPHPSAAASPAGLR